MKSVSEPLFSFLFMPINPRPVRIFSILFAGLLFLVFKPVEPFYYRFIDPLDAWQGAAITPIYRALLLALTAAFAFGFKPRIAGVALCLLLFPLVFTWHSPVSRPILVLVLFFLSLLNGGIPAEPAPVWPWRLIQLLLSLVYLANAVAKSTPQYLNGDVLIAMSMTLPNFLVDMSDGVCRIRGLALPAGIAAKASTFMEYFLAVAFWPRSWRWWAAGAGILFHLILREIVRVAMLDWTCLFLYLSFLLPAVKRK